MKETRLLCDECFKLVTIPKYILDDYYEISEEENLINDKDELLICPNCKTKLNIYYRNEISFYTVKDDEVRP